MLVVMVVVRDLAELLAAMLQVILFRVMAVSMVARVVLVLRGVVPQGQALFVLFGLVVLA